MILPNLPTDNLYKFIALTGVTIIIASILFYSSKIGDLYNDLDKVGLDISNLESEQEFIIKDRQELEETLSKLEKSMPDADTNTNIDSAKYTHFPGNFGRLLNDKNFREYYEFIIKYEDRIFPQKPKIDNIRIEHDRISKLNRELEVKIEQVKIMTDFCKTKNKRLFSISGLLIFLVILGSFLATYGFRQWYHKVQKPTDEKLELELNKLKNG